MCNHSSRYGLACLEMANERFFVDSVVRGFHVYKDVWNPVVGETLICEKEFGNLHDPYAVSVVRGSGIIVGHVPRKISSLSYFFLRKNGTITCQITGRRLFSEDLPQGGPLHFNVRRTKSRNYEGQEAHQSSTNYIRALNLILPRKLNLISR